jgi:hypothetical protein
MKKLIIILLLIPILANAQMQLSEDWSFKADKVKHGIAGVVIAIPSYYLMYNYTGDHEVSRNAAWMIPAFAALGKEFTDGMQGKEISLADAGYTIFSGLVTAWVCKGIAKRKQRKWEKKFDIEF